MLSNMDIGTKFLIACALATVVLVAWMISVARGMTLARVDGLLRQRSLPAWVVFRATAGTVAAFGLYVWVGIWFQRGFWLGVSMAVMCVMVLANELGLLRRLGGRPQHLP